MEVAVKTIAKVSLEMLECRQPARDIYIVPQGEMAQKSDCKFGSASKIQP
jgi:hypothetical protein